MGANALVGHPVRVLSTRHRGQPEPRGGVTHERAGSAPRPRVPARSALRPSGQTPFQIPGHRWAVAVARHPRPRRARAERRHRGPRRTPVRSRPDGAARHGPGGGPAHGVGQLVGRSPTGRQVSLRTGAMRWTSTSTSSGSTSRGASSARDHRSQPRPSARPSAGGRRRDRPARPARRAVARGVDRRPPRRDGRDQRRRA
jgi:hypothetical protein